MIQILGLGSAQVSGHAVPHCVNALLAGQAGLGRGTGVTVAFVFSVRERQEYYIWQYTYHV